MASIAMLISFSIDYPQYSKDNYNKKNEKNKCFFHFFQGCSSAITSLCRRTTPHPAGQKTFFVFLQKAKPSMKDTPPTAAYPSCLILHYNSPIQTGQKLMGSINRTRTYTPHTLLQRSCMYGHDSPHKDARCVDDTGCVSHRPSRPLNNKTELKNKKNVFLIKF